MKTATVLKQVKAAGKEVTHTNGKMNWVKLDSGNSLFWIDEDGTASCLCVEGNGWSARASTVKHLQSVLY